MVQTQDSSRLTMAQALVKYLQVQFSERDGHVRRLIPSIFGIFGHGNVAGLGQALYEYGQALPYRQPRNEQSMVHTALGFAKANYRLATLACTSSIGPGATNMISGAATAAANRLPVLLLPSDYYATRYQGTVLQDLEHPISADLSVNDCFRPVSRFFDRISRPEQLLTALPEAMRVLMDPADTGPVTIALPQDVQTQAYNYPSHFFERHEWRVERRAPDQKRIREAIRLLQSARRPMIIAGGGIHYAEAWHELKSFSEKFGIPVSETSAGKGSIRTPSPFLLGGQGVSGTSAAAKISSTTDLVLTIGGRSSDFTTGSQSAFNNPSVKFININVQGRDAYKQNGLPIVADARATLEALLNAATAARIKPDDGYRQEIVELNAAWETRLNKDVSKSNTMHQGQLIRVLNDQAQEGDVVIAAAGTPPSDLLKAWDATGGRGCHLEFGNSCMGYEIPAGLGVRMTQSKGEVYVLIGDGTYLMNPSELVTAMQEDLKLTVVLSQNHGFQSISALQMSRAGRRFGNEFRSRDAEKNRLEGEYMKIDFAQNAASLGARTWQVHTPEELTQALSEARNDHRTCMIVVDVEPHHYLPDAGVWWDVAAAETSRDPETQKRRREYEEGRRFQRFLY